MVIFKVINIFPLDVEKNGHKNTMLISICFKTERIVHFVFT